MRGKIKTFFAAASLMVIATAVVAILSNPLRQSTDDIELWILEKTPIGTPMEEIREVIESNGWELRRGHQEHLGFHHPGNPDAIGEQSLRAKLGEYQGMPWWVWVEAFWGFDVEGRLVEVYVEKTFDSP